MTMEQEMKNTAAAIRAQLVANGLILEPSNLLPVETDPRFVLTLDEVVLVRKVLQVANTLFTVADTEYHENKIDALLRKLKEAEHVC